MKKILFSLVALMCSMSMNAQVMKVMKDGEVVATFSGAKYKFVFERASAVTTTGTAKRTGNIDVNWVQLWENGPRFAEYNVGAANNKAEDYGGYYFWGKSTDKDPNHAYKDGTDALTGADDTATNLWGDNWRMPTQAELKALLANCDVEWTTVNGVNGRKYTGKGDYASNSMFLPAAGYFTAFNTTDNPGRQGYYWSSTPNDDEMDPMAWGLSFQQNNQGVWEGGRDCARTVRAVLAE